MKRVFGLYEAVFDVLYLITVFAVGVLLIVTAKGDTPRLLAGIMALILGGGDAFHLLPRIAAIRTRKEEALRPLLGRGKQITSITMTAFYVLLWHIGLLIFHAENIRILTIFIYVLALIRILLCLAPQNRWKDRFPPLSWAIYRNIPFFILGAMISGLYYVYRNTCSGIEWMWLAVLLSFAFYLPVVLLANRNPKVGMLMLPKTCAYLWMSIMCLNL